MALMFIDLDNFKTVNDKHGHDAGDEVLCSCAPHDQRSARAMCCAAWRRRICADLPLELPDEGARRANGATPHRCGTRHHDHIRAQIMPIGATVGLAFAPVDANDRPRC
jgi:GGDEF domain-containing protein